MLKIAVINCYDSFVYNLVELLRRHNSVTFDIWGYDQLSEKVSKQEKKDRISLPQIVSSYDAILLSPGPGIPEELPLLSQLIHLAEGKCTILGVCLGLQSIAYTYGATLIQLPFPTHGVEDHLSIISPKDSFLNGISEEDWIGRYHSWMVDSSSLPSSLSLLAIGQCDNTPMVIRHREFPIYGVQFHPESYISTHPQYYIRNWIEITTTYKQSNHTCKCS